MGVVGVVENPPEDPLDGNPFVPCFGVPPPELAGRDDFLHDMSQVLSGGLYRKSGTSIVMGSRGSGKSALLRVVERRAQREGWGVMAVTPSSHGLTPELRAAAGMLWDDIAAEQRPRRKLRLSGARFPGVAAAFEAASDTSAPTGGPNAEPGLRRLLTGVCRQLADAGSAVLVTIDELQLADPDEVRDFAKVFQHLRGGRSPVAFLGAGLPELRETILSGRDATFLQRCKRYEIGNLSDRDTRRALGLPLADRGRTVAAEDLARMVRASRGYPYMVQLVGASTWDAARGLAHVPSEAVEQGIRLARDEIGDELYATVWDRLSPLDKRLAVAMLHHRGAGPAKSLSAVWGGSLRASANTADA